MSLVDRLAEFFRARPGVWIDGRELAKVAGAYAWRSRVSDCRTKLGMVIENRERIVKGMLEIREHMAYTISEYRYLPKEDAGGS